MNSSRITEILFGIADEEPLSRAEKIERIKKAIESGDYVSDEKLQTAFELMLKEIQSG
ncbi:MAG: flagellar biosynthesis anti-sigma factor FlgM [Planctomycetota bacterium JB042]